MRFSDVFAASLVAPLVAAHGGDIPGAPRLFGVPKNLRARNPWAGHQNIGHAAGPVAAPKLQTRQGGADGRCGADGGGASCAAGYCCSSSGWCGNTNEYCAAPDCQINFGTGCDANKTPYGATTRNDPRPQLGSIAYGGVGIRECVKPKTVAITYDDGPYKYTEAVMSQFEKLGGRATFFITGNNLGKGSIDENWRDVISKMYANGHQIASHTWSHQNLDEITQQQRFDQMVKNEMAIRNIIGKYPTYMRPPYSACNTAACQADLKTLGYVSTSFDLDTDDYNQLTKEKIQIAKDNFKKGMDLAGANGDALAIAHDIHELTAMNLTAYMLESVYSKGWTAVTVGECMGDPKANWYRDSAAGVRPSATPSSSAPVPTPTGPTSADGQCGSTTAGAGQSCIGFVGPDGISECCSQSGWCGRSADHCGTGCNPLFGKCGTQPSISASATISKTSAAPLPTVSLETSADGLCGATAGKTCKGFLLDGAKAECCSQYGYCGNTDAHCGLACNPIYGNCGSSGSSSSAVISSAASSSASVSKSASASASASVSKSASASASASVSKASSAVSSTSAHASVSASASASASASISKSASASASASVSKASSAASSSSASASKYDVSISTSASASTSVTKHESSPVPVTVSSSATPSASASKHESSPIPDTKTSASTPATSVYSVNTPSPSSSKAVPSSTGYPDQATTQVYPSTMSTLFKPTSTPCDDDKVAKPTPTGPPVSKDGKCGKDNGGQTCAGYKNPFGQTIECCCKESGRCSTDPWACGVGCDPKFGNCNKY